MTARRLCTINGCARPHYGKGYCRRHYEEANAEHIAATKRAYQREHREEIAAKKRVYRVANADRDGAARAVRYRANVEHELARQAAWREENSGRVRERAVLYYQAHADEFRTRCAARRALKQSLYVERMTDDDVWVRDAGVCHLCGQPADRETFHVDHIIPLSLGGPHCLDNAAVSHPRCNRSKGDRLTNETMASPRFAGAVAAYIRFHGAGTARYAQGVHVPEGEPHAAGDPAASRRRPALVRG